MSTRADLLALAERCEREKPSPTLDAAIAVALRIGPTDAPTWFNDNFPVWRTRGDGRVEVVHDDGRGGAHYAPLPFTASCDAADTLRPASMPITVALADRWIVYMDVAAHVGIADTEAAARCAAGIRARAAMVPS